MEFWGIEVKPGETVKCDPGEDKFLHISQASLGETKKDKASENVPVFVKFNDQKLVIGTLSGEKFPQISYDLVFEKEFELCHSSKSTSVFFCGYKGVAADDIDGYSGTDSEEEAILLGQKANGKPEVKEQAKLAKGKPTAAKGDALPAKPKVKTEESNKADKPKVVKDDDDDDEDDDEDDSEDDESASDDDMPGAGDDSDDDDDDDEDDDESSDEEDEVTPKKTEIGKKRAAESASKTPAPEKKAKLVSPAGSQKTGDGKKGGHTATPHPAKQVGKTLANDKSKQQTPKSGGGSVTCKSCSKTFNSDNALQAHSKAKHSAGK